MTPYDAAAVAAAEMVLRTDPDYRVLRRLGRPAGYGEAVPVSERLVGAVLDLETTSKDPDVANVVELGLVLFEFTREGRIGRVLDVGGGYEDPGEPLPAEITEITGITDDMVRGTRLPDDIGVDSVHLVIAHNAEFDRRIAERRWPILKRCPWACSQRDVPWAKFGIRGQKLDYLLMETARAFHDAHSAINDCVAVLHVLAQQAPDGETYFRHLLAAARTPTVRVWAVDAPYGTKDTLLKPRGYRWSDGRNGRAKCWYRDIAAVDREVELAWLADHVYQPHGVAPRPEVRHIRRVDQFSARTDAF